MHNRRRIVKQFFGTQKKRRKTILGMEMQRIVFASYKGLERRTWKKGSRILGNAQV